MVNSQEIIYWLGNSLVGLGTAAAAVLSWMVKRQVTRLDRHEDRLNILAQTTATHVDLEAAIVRIEDTHQRGTDQTNQRLDNIYQLLVTLRSSN